MSLKYVGGIISLIGVRSSLFMGLGTTGSGVMVEGVLPTALFWLSIVVGLVGSVLVLRGTTKVGAVLALLRGLVLMGLALSTGKVAPWLPGGLLTVGGGRVFRYKEPGRGRRGCRGRPPRRRT